MHSLHVTPSEVLISFFFQAEDGIRDLTVTGVQTCALPISLRPAGFLIDERLDARHDGRSERRAAGAGPSAWIGAAGSPAVLSIRPAENVEVAPESIGSEERNVRSVAHAVVGIAEYALPGRFRPSLASAADDAACRRGPGCALADRKSTTHGGLEEGAVDRIVAKTC